MEYYLTTYTKDFKWPVPHSPAKAQRLAENADKMTKEQVRTEPCAAYLKQPAVTEPQIDPAQCGAPPAGPESKFGQPLTYLRKLYSKYPYLYQILKLTSPEELAKIVYSDKYVSTYSSDYQVQGFTPLKNWLIPEQDKNQPSEALQSGLEWPKEPICGSDGPNYQALQPNDKEVRQDGRTSCGCIEKTKELTNTEKTRMVGRKPASISTIPRALPTTSKPAEEAKPRSEFNSGKSTAKGNRWRTEYRDTINHTGDIIIKKKLLTRPPEPCE